MLRKGEEPIPGYRLERFLGRGQYGEVWQATAPGTRAALKFIDLSGKHGLKELRGITRVKEIRHPHLMPITAMWMLDESGNILGNETFDSVDRIGGLETAIDPQATLAITDSVRPHMLIVAMLLGKKNLQDRLDEAKAAGQAGIPIQELLIYMEEAAKGIDFLNKPQHDLGEGVVSIQHCDIKPANIMLLGDAVLICDFGLARILGTNLQTTATGMVGSPAYMAPECIRRKPSLGSDQYSLAISYAELRTGRLPFYDETYAAVLLAHENGTLKLDYLPPAEAAVIARATSLNPADRFPSCLIMVEALKVAAGSSPATLVPIVDEDHHDRETLAHSPGAPSRETVAKRSTAKEFLPAQAPGEPRKRSRVAPILATTLLAALCVVLALSSKQVQKFFTRTPAGRPGKVVAKQDSKPAIDLAALANEAHSYLREGKATDAEQAYRRMLTALADADPQKKVEYETTAHVGILRARLRQSSPDWKSIASESKRLLEAQAALPPDQRLAVQTAHLLAVANSGEGPLLSRLSLADLETIQQQIGQLDSFEKQTVEELKTQVLQELGATEQLDDGTLQQVAAIWPGNVQFTFRVSRIRRAIDERNWAEFQKALNAAEAVNLSDAERQQIAVLKIRANLANPEIPLTDSLAGLAATKDIGEDLVGILRDVTERWREEPSASEAVLTALASLHANVREDQRSAVNIARQEIARSVIERAVAADFSISKLNALCEDFRSLNEHDPLVNAVWVETCLAAGYVPGGPVVEVTLADWNKFDKAIAAGVAAMEKEPSSDKKHYLQLVRAILNGRSSLPKVRDGAADEIIAVHKAAPALFVPVTRQKLCVDVCLAAARREGIASDVDLDGEKKVVANEKAWRYLLAARLLHKPPPDELAAAMVIEGVQQKDLNANQRQQLILDADRLLVEGDPIRTDWLKKNRWTTQLPLAAAELHAQHFQQSQQAEHLRKALRLFARALKNVYDPARVNSGMRDVKIYQRILSLARPLLDQANSEILTEVRDRQAAAELWGALARIVLRDVTVAHTHGGTVSPEQFAQDAFRRAAELQPRADFIVGQAMALLYLPDDGEKKLLNQLEELWKQASELSPDDPGVHNLRGYILTKQSRVTASREESLRLLQSAIDSYKKAIALSDKNDFTPDYYEGLSAASLEAAFYSSRLVKRPYLVAAESAAKEALKFEIRRQPWEAHIKLGNAYEDQGHYLFDKTFPAALEAFAEGYNLAERRGSPSHRASALMCLGRARARYAASGDVRPEELEGQLNRAEEELREAIKIWSDLPKKKGTQVLAAQAHYFISEVLDTKLRTVLTSRPVEEQIAAVTASVKECELAATAAWEAQAFMWPLCQIAWIRRTTDLAMLHRDANLREQTRQQAAARAQAVINEFERNTIGYKISLDYLASALQSLIIVNPGIEQEVSLVDQHLAKFPDDGRSGSELRFLFLAERAKMLMSSKEKQHWGKYSSVCRRDIQSAGEIASRLELAESKQLFGAEAIELQARLAVTEARELPPAGRREKLQAAIDLFEKALERYGDFVQKSTPARVILASLYYSGLEDSKLTPAQRRDLAKRILEILEPVEEQEVFPADREAIQQYRVKVQSILKA